MKEIGDRVFNTGKVHIGASYHPVRVKPMTYDAERIQKALMKEYMPRSKYKTSHKITYILLIAALIAAATLM